MTCVFNELGLGSYFFNGVRHIVCIVEEEILEILSFGSRLVVYERSVEDIDNGDNGLGVTVEVVTGRSGIRQTVVEHIQAR